MPDKADDTTLPSFADAVSQERWAPYCQGVDQETAERRYRWNIELCEALYPSLHLFEVAVRNALYVAIRDHYNDPSWFDQPWIGPNETEKVTYARSTLRKDRKPDDDPGRIVAELSFGFWCALFNRRYEHQQALWPWLVKPTFPRLGKGMRDVRKLERWMNAIRRLRNRVFHHEPIWHWHDLRDQHQVIAALINGISPAVAEMHSSVDRFVLVRRGRP